MTELGRDEDICKIEIENEVTSLLSSAKRNERTSFSFFPWTAADCFISYGSTSLLSSDNGQTEVKGHRAESPSLLRTLLSLTIDLSASISSMLFFAISETSNLIEIRTPSVLILIRR